MLLLALSDNDGDAGQMIQSGLPKVKLYTYGHIIRHNARLAQASVPFRQIPDACTAGSWTSDSDEMQDMINGWALASRPERGPVSG